MTAYALCALFSFLVFEVAADDRPEDAPVDWTAKAQEAWHKTCQTCHAVPDTRFETDRAFLRQITETT